MTIDSFLKRSAFWERDRLEGSPVRKGYDEIDEAMRDKDVGLYIQGRNLSRLLSHAASHAPFYKAFSSHVDDLPSWPVMDKSLLLEEYDSHLVPYEEIPGQVGDLYIQRTSGSTGVPFALP